MNEINNSRILITGGNGFIGATLASQLITSNNQVDILDMAPGLSGAALSLGLHQQSRIRYFQGDVLDPNCFEILNQDYDYVVHAAAILGIKRVCVEPLLTLRVNITGTDNCLRFCAKLLKLKRVLLFSTSEVYGPTAVESNEDQDLVVAATGMRWCYATSKIAAEQLAAAYANEYNLPTVVVRPFNVYGPHRIGTNAVTSIIGNLLTDRPIILSGTGNQTRAWCYIDDFIDGLKLCLAHPEGSGKTFNIGNPHEVHSIIEAAVLVRSIIGSMTPIVISGSKEPDVIDRSPDIRRAELLLGFTPKVTFFEGLSRTIAWHRARTDQFVSMAA